MSAKFTKEQLRELAEGIADGLPIGALAGVAGVSSPTITNKLHNADFLCEIAGAFDETPDDLMERLEHWYCGAGERATARALRLRLAVVLRRRFHDADERERADCRRRRKPLIRGGRYWYWRDGAWRNGNETLD